MPAPTIELTAAARTTVEFLADAVPLRCWLVALVDETGGWTPLAVADRGYGFVEGQRLAWQDTVCSRMVQGLGPHVAARVVDVVDYADAPILHSYPIGAYIGAALLGADGALVGTLCGLDPEPQPLTLQGNLPTVLVVADLLSRLHAAQADRTAAVARAAQAEAVAQIDTLTGALSRLGWTDRLGQALAVCDRSGNALALLSLDLDELKEVNDRDGHLAGDDLLRAVPQALSGVLRPGDLLARTGGDEFAVAAVVADEHGLQRLLARVRKALAVHGLRVSAGGALRAAGTPVERAWSLADERMYAAKAGRRGPGAPAPRDGAEQPVVQDEGTRST